jgi:4-carboxymuconolactone decarboxylase
VTRYVFGEIWARDEVPRKLRCIITLSMLVALNRQPQIKNLMRAALRSGASREEIREVTLQAAIYCGVPTAVDTTRLAMEVFDELDKA